MKRIWLFMMIFLTTSCLVLITSTFFCQKTNKIQRELAGEVIRFHVRANSDEACDQEIKLKVKNAVVDYLRPILEGQDNVVIVHEIIEGQLSQIKSVAEKTLNEIVNAGYSREMISAKNDSENAMEVSVQFKKENFPEKRYGDFVFPKGTYKAVVISLGEGMGQNWWCMLYPGLCFVNESYAVVSEKSGEKLEEVLSEDAFAWICRPEGRKWGFRWLDFGK